MGRADLQPQLSGFSHPVLIMHGKVDRSFPFEEAEVAKQVLGDAVKSFALVGNGAHVLPATHPKETNDVLIPFLDSHARA